MRVKQEGEKVGLKLNIQKTKIMASNPIPLCQIDEEKMEMVRNSFWGFQNTADGDCSHKMKISLLLGRRGKTNLDSILKSRDIVNKGQSSQSYGFFQ